MARALVADVSRTFVAALIVMGVALAGCADEPLPEPEPSGTDALDAYTVLQDNPVGGDATLLGFFGHSSTGNRVPWPLGPVSTYEHMHLSGGGNRVLDQGTAQAWYSLHLNRGAEEPKIVLSKVTSEVTVERSFDAEHFGWTMEWAATEDAAESGARTAEHGGHACAVGSFTDDWNVGSHDAWETANANPLFAEFRDTMGGQPIMLYLPNLHLHGDDCTRTTPLGFEFLPQTNVWAIFLTDIDMFLQGGVFGDSIVAIISADTGEVLDVSTFSETWGTNVRHSELHTFQSDLPGTPVVAQQFEVPFSVNEGAANLEVATRLLSGPEVYADPTVSLSGPDYSETATGDHSDWSVASPTPGAWTVTYTFNQAQPIAGYEVAVVALTN